MFSPLLIFLIIPLVRAVWPLPQIYEPGNSTLWLSPDVRFDFEGFETPSYTSTFSVWDHVQRIFSGLQTTQAKPQKSLSLETLQQVSIERLNRGVFQERFVPRKFHQRNSPFEPKLEDQQSKIYIDRIRIKKVSIQVGLLSQLRSTKEAYAINMEADGKVIIETASENGVLHAMETFRQLFYAHSSSSVDAYTPYAPVLIKDAPRFEHRGLNLDISRNWIPPSDVLRVIEAMSLSKLNRLHLHAADAQSWPLEIPAYPELALKGAYDPSQIWTKTDLEIVQGHGNLHGVEVFLEIDMPGHTTAIGHAFPGLITAPAMDPWDFYAAEPPSGQLRLNSSAVGDFVLGLLNDLLPRSKTWSLYFHLGGDELNRNAYGLDPTMNTTTAAAIKPHLQRFTDTNIDTLKAHGVTPIVWEEMLVDWNLTLPSNVLIQTWRSSEILGEVLKKGHRAIFGSNSHWYLDCGKGTFLNPNTTEGDAKARIKPPFLDYCAPFKNWRQVYDYNPLKDIPKKYQHQIVGGEVHLWGELTDSVNLDNMLWPRVAAAAEVLWRGPGNPVSEDVTRRLAEMRERLVLKGVKADMVQMEWCLRNKGGCSL
ncbi:glycoside hydrolase family 20 protein [Aulographum hederae CBS 113979]|uniref:Beta-hexosaminidase n=1 Tax=Aulographum hederae CBS 113979 TaxID=1176131 RepID=A0A6G1GU79_9PEZI|nr:glycoside hydrolase family 20 protein [Aulographum hederae CBS 113979]